MWSAVTQDHRESHRIATGWAFGWHRKNRYDAKGERRYGIAQFATPLYCPAMRGSILLILIVGFGLLFVVRLRHRLALLAEQVRQLRANALEPVSYSPAAGGALDDVLGRATAEATALGFISLGDHVEHATLASADRTMRWLVDGAGTTFGWLAPFDVEGKKFVLAVLMSHELDQQTITSRQPVSSTLVRPPFVDMQMVATSTSLTDVVAKHRKRAQLDDADRAFIPVRTFEQLDRELARMRDKVVAWRKAQPAGELLDADLRSLLGPQYSKLAGPLRRRLS